MGKIERGTENEEENWEKERGERTGARGSARQHAKAKKRRKENRERAKVQTNLYDRKIIGMYKRNLQAIQNNLVTFFCVYVCACLCVNT